MADAYARKNDTKDEFAIYDSVLQEFATNAQNVPLGTPMFLTKASINDPRTLTRMAARLIRKETRIDKAQPPKFPGPRSFRSVRSVAHSN